MYIETAVIIVAGYGTRFYPATKEQPKEMFPVGNKPIVHRIVEQLSEAGIKNYILVSRNGNNTTFEYFHRNKEYDAHLEGKNKTKLIEESDLISRLGNFTNTVQNEQNGDGDALLCGIKGRSAEPYLVVFPDFLVSPKDRIFTRMMDTYRIHRCPIIAMDTVPDEDLHNYGVIDVQSNGDPESVIVNEFVEKPQSIEEAPSNLVFTGYSIVTPDVINYLEIAESSVKDGEVRIADAFTQMLKDKKEIRGVTLNQNGYDCGQPTGWLDANIDFALNGDDREKVIEMLKKKLREIESQEDSMAQYAQEQLSSLVS